MVYKGQHPYGGMHSSQNHLERAPRWFTDSIKTAAGTQLTTSPAVPHCSLMPCGVVGNALAAMR